MERPTKEIKLPVSGYTAKVATFLTRGETKVIANREMEGGELEYLGTEVHIKNIPIDSIQRKEDALLKVGIKSLVKEDGQSIDVTDEVIDSLPDKDIRTLLSELVKVEAGTGVPDSKK